MRRLLTTLLFVACAPTTHPEWIEPIEAPSASTTQALEPPEPSETSDTAVMRMPDVDADDDGVVDAFDDFPKDPTRSLLGLGPSRVVPPGRVKLGSPPYEVGRLPYEEQRVERIRDDLMVQLFETTEEDFRGPDTPHPTRAQDEVSFIDALRYANRLSTRAGLRRCYEFVETYCPTAKVRANCDGFRLPTNEEWEYLARSAGQVFDAFPSGGNLRESHHRTCARTELTNDRLLDEQARTCADPGDGEVGTAMPNALGLYDMSGNVAEWVWTGPQQVPGDCDLHQAIRGGDRGSLPIDARIAARRYRNAFEGVPNVGFRLVRTLSTP